MYSKVIVLEIKSKYCLAITDEGIITRIKKKDNIKVGDRIYILEEDIYLKENKSGIVIPFPKVTRKTFIRASSIAVAIMLCFSIMLAFPRLSTKVYAAISIDAASDLQLKISKDYEIVSAVSYDNTISKKELKNMLGQKLTDIKPELISLFGGDSESLLIGYALQKNYHSVSEEYIKEYLFSIFPHKKSLYIKGSSNDITMADQRKMSIGIYLASMRVLDDELEDVLDDMDLEQMLKLLKKQPDLMSDESVREALDKKWKEVYNQDTQEYNEDNNEESKDVSDDQEKSDGDESDDNKNTDVEEVDDQQNPDSDDSDDS